MNYKIPRIALLWLILSMVISAGAQSTGRTISLKEAIELSVKNSNQLKYSKAKIEEATAALREAVERKLPDANVSASHLRLTHPTIDLQLKSNNSSGGSGQAVEPSSATYGIANVSLPLYAGNRIRLGIESSQYLQEAARMDAENDRDGVVMNTVSAYNNLYKARSAVELVKQNLEDSRQRVRDFSNLERNGLLARNELLKAELQESNTELSLLDAENNWKLANINMNLMLGLPDSIVLVPSAADLIRNDVNIKSLDTYVQSALQNRKDMAALEYRKKAAGTAVKSSKAGSYPSIALTGGYIAATVPSVLTVTNALNLGVGVQYNIASLWKNGQTDQYKAKVKEIESNEAAMQDAIKLEVSNAYQNFLLSRKRIEVYDKAILQAEENNRIVKNKFNNALATTTDLLDADIALLQVRLNAAFARADAAEAWNRLLKAAGMLY